MNSNYICLFDYETGSGDPYTTQILQIGAVILDPRTLDIIDEFSTLVKYEDWSKIESKALEINHITKEQLDKAPIIDIAWKQFTQFINKYGKQNKWNKPIPAGQNIMNFDIPITNRYAKRFGNWNKKENRNNLFHPFLFIDTVTIFFTWFENQTDPRSYGQANVAKYMGFTQAQLDALHNAVEDVKVNHKIMARFIKFQRELMKRYADQIKGCFK